jgi:hypothetical protein
VCWCSYFPLELVGPFDSLTHSNGWWAGCRIYREVRRPSSWSRLIPSLGVVGRRGGDRTITSMDSFCIISIIPSYAERHTEDQVLPS